MPSPRVYFGLTSSGGSTDFDDTEITFVNAQADYNLPSSVKDKSASFFLEHGSKLTPGTDYTIAGNVISLILASDLCQTLVAGDKIIGNWAKA